MNRHAIKFEITSHGESLFCYIKIEGDLTHEDYEFFVPAFEEAIQTFRDPHIKLLADITQLEHLGMHAIWDDLKFGLEHGSKFTKIAVVGHNRLYEYGVKLSRWFVPGQMEYFEDFDEAKFWLFG